MLVQTAQFWLTLSGCWLHQRHQIMLPVFLHLNTIGVYMIFFLLPGPKWKIQFCRVVDFFLTAVELTQSFCECFPSVIGDMIEMNIVLIALLYMPRSILSQCRYWCRLYRSSPSWISDDMYSLCGLKSGKLISLCLPIHHPPTKCRTWLHPG